MLMGDGSVRLVLESIDLLVWRGLGTIDNSDNVVVESSMRIGRLGVSSIAR